MVTASELSGYARELGGMAGRLESYAGSMSSVYAELDKSVSDIPDFWGGPLADDVISVANDFVGQVSGADGHIDAIATALRTLAGDADELAGDLTTLNNLEEPPDDIECQIGEVGSLWTSAIRRFDESVDGAITELQSLSAYDWTLPRSPNETDFATAVVELIGGEEAIYELAVLLLYEEDAEGFQELADLVGVWLGTLPVFDPDGTDVNSFLDGGDPEVRRALEVMVLVSETMPTAVLPWAIHPNRRWDLHHWPEGLAVLEELTGTTSDFEMQVSMLDRFLQQDPWAMVVIGSTLDSGRFNNTMFQAIIVATSDFIEGDVRRLDEVLDMADDGIPIAAQAVPGLIAALDWSGADVNAIINSYAAYRVESAFDGSTEIRGQLVDAGEAMSRLQIAAEEHGAGVEFDLAGAGVDLVLLGVGEIPIVGQIVGGGQVVIGNVQFPEATDFAAGAIQNQEDFGVAIDLLTAGHPDREAILDDLGMLGENGEVVPPDRSMRALAETNPEYIPLIQYADDLADGMAIPRGQSQ